MLKKDDHADLPERIAAYETLIGKLCAVHEDRAGLQALDPYLRVTVIGHIDKLRQHVALMQRQLQEMTR